MASLRTQNALLFVIALCLMLLVVHFYSGHLVEKAYAEQTPPASNSTRLYGCLPNPKKDFNCDWIPVRVDKFGRLVTVEPKK